MKQIWRTLKFAFNYSQKIDRGILFRIWLSRIYADLYPIISSYLLKLSIDTAINVINKHTLFNPLTLGGLFLIWFAADGLDQFSFRYQLMLMRIMQRKLSSRLEADLAYLHASVPVETVENPKFRDEYTFVKREVSFRMFTVVGAVIDIISSLIGVCVAGLVMVGFNPWYAVILFCVLTLRFIGIDKALKKSVTALQTSSKYNRHWEIYQSYLESAKSSYETRILGIKDMVKKRMQEIMSKTVGLYSQTEHELFPQRVISAILPMLAVLSICYHALLQVLKGLISVGDWQLLFNSSTTFSDKFKNFIDSVTTTKESGEYINHLIDLFAWNKKSPTQQKGLEITHIKNLEFRNVSFHYPNSDHLALKNITFTIRENENVAIVGINGAGKTTLVKLLCRFYEPTAGEILINGENIQQFNQDSYWQSISALFQDFEKYPISARESIGYGDITRMTNIAEIIKSAKLMGMDDYFQSLPAGYDTPLIRDLENGTDLSTGQWQKTALSRALFRPSQIIILDEPTSNIDPQSEEEIFSRLITLVKSKIMLLISHRFSTVKRAGHILVFDKGELIEEGSHKELMAKKGMYAKLFKIQAKSYSI